MKNIAVLIILFFIETVGFAQWHSEKVIDEKIYGLPTKWSCIDRHFGFVFANYLMSIKTINSMENAPASGKWQIGYDYRIKIAKNFDIGMDLSYSYRFSRTKKTQTYDGLSVFEGYSWIKTINHNIEPALFLRFDLAKANHRNLGFFIDLGAFYSFSFARNYFVFFDSKNIFRKTKIKKPTFISQHDYGIFIKFGYNYISIFAEYSFGYWQKLELRSPLLIGIQLNLYTK